MTTYDISFNYNGKLWIPASTVSDKNSFFHSVFGKRANEHAPHFDEQAICRRKQWSDFLIHFMTETMPNSLADMLRECLSKNEKYKYTSIDDKNCIENYAKDITKGDQDVTINELAVLATVFNMKIVVFSNKETNPIVIVAPNDEILHNYSNGLKKSEKDAMLYLDETIFLRLHAVDENFSPTSDKSSRVEEKNKTNEKNILNTASPLAKYEKGNSAGSKGVEFQINLLIVCLLNAFRRLSNWRLSSENNRAGKFDDVILEWSQETILLQAKHKDDKKQKVSLNDLMSANSKNSDFSLPKYFLSYLDIKNNFKIKNVIICTNACLDCKVFKFVKTHKVCSHSILYHEDDSCSFFTFTEDILPFLKQNITSYCEKNLKNIKSCNVQFTDEDLQLFLEHLQFYADYPSRRDLVYVVEKILSSINVYQQISPLDIYARVMIWFQQKRGVYLTATYVKAIFLEIWRDRYLLTLNQYNIQFIHNDDLNLKQLEKVVYIVTDNGCFLQELKIYAALKDSKEKLLHFNCNDSIYIQEQIIEAFQLPQYIVLIIIWHKFCKQSAISMCRKLKQIIVECEYKKIIVVSDNYDDKLAQEMNLKNGKCVVMKRSVAFSELSKETQEMLLQKKSIIFQGKVVNLQELFKAQTVEDYDQILDSEILETLVGDEKIRVGLQLLCLDTHISRFYIDRQFKEKIKTNDEGMRENNISEEVYHEGNIFETTPKFILITDSAGMGKSTVLTNIAVIIKEKNPDLWVIRIELNDYSNFLNEQLQNNRETIDVIELLNSKNTSAFINKLERYVFSLTDKVVLLLDGLDEIAPDYTELILSMLSQCQEASNFVKIFVTSRPHITEQLELRLPVKSFVLEPFTENNQVQFLTSYWTHNLKLELKHKKKCEKYAKALISKMLMWINAYSHEENHFAGIPLQARMLAEIFQENNQKDVSTDWEGCKEYLNGNESKPKLLEKIDIIKLYEMFIEKKRKVFIYRGNPNSNVVINQALLREFRKCLSYSRSLALQVILGKHICKFFYSFRKDVDNSESDILKLGIVQKVNNELNFVHRTFAEYFVGESLLIELQHQNQNLEFQNILFKGILLNRQFTVIRTFFDNFLRKADVTLSPKIFQNCRIFMDDNYLSDLKYKHHLIHLLAEEGRVEIIRLLCKCTNFKFIKVKRLDSTVPSFMAKSRRHMFGKKFFVHEDGVNISDVSGRTPLHYASKNNHLEMVKFLIEQGAVVNICHNIYGTPLDEAVRSGNFDIIKFLVEHGADIELKGFGNCLTIYNAIIRRDVRTVTFFLETIMKNDNLDKDHSMGAYTAGFLGNLIIIKDLIERGLDANSKIENGESLIFGAARGKQLETIRYLITKGADINIKDTKENTLLHMTSVDSSLTSVVELLIELGANLDATNLRGRTPLHEAAKCGNVRVAELLIENGAGVDIKDQHGDTPFYLAALSDQLQVVKALGVNSYAVDDYGRTLLHFFARKGKVKMIKFLVELGVDMDIRDNDGCTALYIAALWGNLNCVKLLVESGANVNVGNKFGRTVLHICASQNQWNLIQYLIQHGADITVVDDDGHSALHEALLRKNTATVKILMEHCMD